MFLLNGEPGIGKTSLAESAADEARVRGAGVYWGHSTQAEGAPPHWPWLQVLRSLAEDLGADELARLAGEGLHDVLLVAPFLRGHLAESASSKEDEAARFHAYDAVGRLLIAASERRPLLLVLEDLHWADAPSLILLQQLAGRLTRSRILVVATYRELELTPDHPLSAGLADFVRAGETVEIPLRGLSKAHVASLLRTLTAFEPASDVVQRVHEQTAGNPFFLKEVARTLRDDGDEPHPHTRADAVPEGVAAVLRRRISSLSPSARETLGVASVAGQELDLKVLSAATHSPRAALVDDCDEAAKAGVLVRRADVYSFSHGLFRDTVYAELTSRRRAELHHQVGRALERVSHGAPPSQLAHHFLRAAQTDESLQDAAVDYSLRAGVQASAELAYEEAVRHFEHALGFADLVPPLRRAELLLALGRARYLAGDPADALTAAREASEIGKTLGDGELLARAALVVRGVGGPGLTPAVKSLCDASLRRPSSEASLRIQVLIQLSVSLMQMVEPDAAARAEEVSREAMRLASAATDPDIVFAALHARQMAMSGPDGVAERLALAQRTIDLSRETGRAVFADWGHGWSADALVQLGRIDEAELHLVEQGRAADVLREPLARWRYLVARSWLALVRGNFDAARKLSDEARSMVSTSSHPIAELADLRGKGDGLREEMGAFASRYPEMGGPFMVFQVIGLASEGRLAEARMALRPMAAIGVKNIRPLMAWLPAMAYAANAAAAVGDSEIAAEVYQALVPYAGQNIATGAGTESVFGSVSHHLGKLAATLGRFDDAAGHFEAAIALERKMGAPPFVARSQVLYAEMLAAHGDAAALRNARGLAEKALAASQELGMTPWMLRAKAVLTPARRRAWRHTLSRGASSRWRFWCPRDFPTELSPNACTYPSGPRKATSRISVTSSGSAPGRRWPSGRQPEN